LECGGSTPRGLPAGRIEDEDEDDDEDDWRTLRIG